MPPTIVDDAARGEVLNQDIAGLGALEQAAGDRTPRWRLWSAAWPKLAALGLGLLIWQLVFWSEWKDEFLFRRRPRCSAASARWRATGCSPRPSPTRCGWRSRATCCPCSSAA